jgi:hypothetical protein
MKMNLKIPRKNMTTNKFKKYILGKGGRFKCETNIYFSDKLFWYLNWMPCFFTEAKCLHGSGAEYVECGKTIQNNS